MTTSNFEENKIYYLKSGAEVSLIQELKGDQYLVAPVVYNAGSWDEPPYEELGNPIIVSSLFHSAPIEKVDSEILKRRDLLDELNKSIADKKLELTRLEQTYAKKVKDTPILSMLNLYLEGKANYCVCVNSYYKYQVEIGKPSEILQIKGSYSSKGEMKLVTLYGRPGNGYEFRINEYADNSGTEKNIAYFFETLEEATEFGIEKVTEALSGIPYPIDPKFLPKWYPLSEEYKALYVNSIKAKKETEIAGLKLKIGVLQNELNVL